MRLVFFKFMFVEDKKGEPTRTLVPWKLVCRVPTRTQCMGWFALVVGCNMFEAFDHIKGNCTHKCCDFSGRDFHVFQTKDKGFKDCISNTGNDNKRRMGLHPRVWRWGIRTSHLTCLVTIVAIEKRSSH